MSWRDIPGRAAYLWIYDEWLASNPRQGAIAVEVGVALGKSVAYLAERCIEMGRTDIQVYAVDPWAGTARNGEQQELADAAGGDFTLYATTMMRHAPRAFEFVRPLRMRGADAARAFGRSLGHEVDIVVLDGDHSFLAVHEELCAWLKALREHATIGGDDHHPELFPGVIEAVRDFWDPHEYEVRHVDDWPTWRKRL